VFPYLMRHTAVNHLIDGGASIERARRPHRRRPGRALPALRQLVRPIASIAARLEGPWGLNGSQDGSPNRLERDRGAGPLAS
jgi:hypothetical protein